jgi:hypothetical protein
MNTMNVEPLLRLYDETDLDAVRRRIASGCASVIKGSVLGKRAGADRELTEDDVARMAEAMTAYILAPSYIPPTWDPASSEALPLDKLPVPASVQLSEDCFGMGQVFGVDEFAEQFSRDLLAESAQFSDTRIAEHDHRYLEDQATAAILFRHKHCASGRGLFEPWAIARWVRLICADRGERVAGKKVLHLLDTLVETTLHNWDVDVKGGARGRP